MKYFFIIGGILICLILTILKFKKHKRKREKINSAIIKSRKFLFLKFEEEALIDGIKSKVFNNVPRNYNAQINYDILKSAGLFHGVPIYKIYVQELNIREKKQIFLLNKISSQFNFDVILLFRNCQIEEYVSKKFPKIKCINIAEINAKLLFELNKININYDGENQKVFEGVFIDDEKVDNFQYKNFRLESKVVLEKCSIECYKILLPDNKKNIFEKNFFDKVQIFVIKNNLQNDIKINLQINLKIANEFVNFEKNGNVLTVKNLEGNNEKFYFSNNNFEILLKKCEKNAFLSVIFANFKIKSNSYSFVSISSIDKNFENYKNVLLKNYVLLKKKFDINFKCKNAKMNKLINENLCNIYCKHFLQIEKNINFNFNSLIKTEQLENLSINKINSYAFVKFLLNKFFGISQNQTFLKIAPNSDIDFFEFNLQIQNKIYRIIYKQNERKFVNYGGLEFVNLDNINLNFVDEKQITFCG